MGHISVVYGIIVGERWHIKDTYRLHRLNVQVIETLPESDDWPFLTRDMFSIALAGSPDAFVQGIYRAQPIHFGATFKEIEWNWDEWLVKFEALLLRLYWNEVYLHLRTQGTVGDYDYVYSALNTSERFHSNEPPLPVNMWEFTGGQRKFDFYGGVFDPTLVTKKLIFKDGILQPDGD